ncbi:eukaryotic translation initiation factor 4E transporter isoform X4 [Falco biarmicus]|uniref:eukaryotic translation initiation factor 4E transporter isoform X4 n=1 Tax=Falco cherrug TaxID=345164 RepID=UPI000FFB233D|nr:eukaryotic translation initiation factor 4E transporter isoform X4 [Falco cherrug]XP_055653618.1 eukaryotic translation initiation factor 4E transporter isoform X4 [Falco peregrinus]XP_056200858.1 eukaryotic translation initiation factor 4E transporter isoform X4 [Falco biarmicus]
MDKRGAVTEAENGDAFLELNRIATKYPHRYTKEELLDIKERPYSKRRPSCLSEKYDSDGVWDPEKWHASLYPTSGRTSPVESFKKDLDLDRTSLMRRIVDPRERVKEDDLDVILSPQRRSFGGGCHVTAAISSRQAGSPLEKENDGVRVIGGRRIGSGRIISSRNFDKDHRGGEKELRDSRDARDRDRERDYKDKRFRREFGDSKRVFGERRRNDSYTEEEPEWFSAGPTSQSETIELTGFDDKILEEDHKGRKRTRRRTASLKEGVECNGGVAEEDEVQTVLASETPTDQEVPREAVLQEPAPGEFDFNEFFNLDKSVPGLASMIEDVLGEGSVSASRFSRWFSNPSRSGSPSSSLRSTPHEELERLAAHSGVVLSVEEVEAGLKGLKVDQEGKIATPFMAEQMEEALNVTGSRQIKKDGDMTAFNKLVSSMKASGTLPSQPKVNQSLESHLMSPPEMPGQPLSKNILQELLGPPITRPASSNVLSGLIGGLEPAASLLTQRAPSPPIPPVFPTRAASADYLRHRISSPIGFGQGSQQLLGDPFPGVRKPMSPVAAQMSPLEIQQATLEGLALPHDLAIQAANFYQHGFGKPQMDKSRDGYRNRQQRVTKSPVPGHRGNASSPAPIASITSMLSPSFTPTSVIRKMYESKEKSKEEPVSGKMKVSDGKDENQRPNEAKDNLLSSSVENADQETLPTLGTKLPALQRSACSTTLTQANRCTKEQDYRPKSAGRKTPTMASPVPGGPFLRPVHQVPLVPHVPIVRPAHQLHPGLVQRMLAQGVHPQHLPLLQAGMLPPGVDLSHLQGISAPILGQPFYPLPTASHHILNPRSGTPLQLAMMQQQLQRSGTGAQGSPTGVQTTPQNVLPRTGLSHGHTQLDHRPSQRSGSPIGLAKWFGSDVLQQPLPSMPSKVISVDELEYRQ